MVPADIQATRNKDYARENKRRFLQDATLVLLQRSEVTLSKCVDDANTLFELIQRKL